MKSLAAETSADLMLHGNRWQASLSLGFADDKGTTRMIERSHRGPLLVQKPLYPEGEDICHAIVVHPPGGVVGGDELTITTRVGEDAHAFITTPGAAKWYKANGQASRQTIHLDVQANASLEWLPQETIFFDAADVRLDQQVYLATTATYLGWEILCFGRTASGEKFDAGRVMQRTGIRRGGKLLWVEQGAICGGASMTSPFSMRDATVCATLLAVGSAIPGALLQEVRESVSAEAEASAWTGATQMKSMCVVRYLGDSSEAAKRALTAAWRLLRPAILGRDAMSPRIWNT